MDCPFCNIIQGTHPDQRELLLDTDEWVAFQSNGRAPHPLLVPRRHIAIPTDLSYDEAAEFPEVLWELLTTIKASEYKMNVNVGHRAGQTVFHMHWHIWKKG